MIRHLPIPPPGMSSARGACISISPVGSQRAVAVATHNAIRIFSIAFIFIVEAVGLSGVSEASGTVRGRADCTTDFHLDFFITTGSEVAGMIAAIQGWLITWVTNISGAGLPSVYSTTIVPSMTLALSTAGLKPPVDRSPIAMNTAISWLSSNLCGAALFSPLNNPAHACWVRISLVENSAPPSYWPRHWSDIWSACAGAAWGCAGWAACAGSVFTAGGAATPPNVGCREMSAGVGLMVWGGGGRVSPPSAAPT